MPVDTVQQQAFWDAQRKATTIPKTVTATQFAFPGFEEMMKDLLVMTPEQMLQSKGGELITKFGDAIRPHSPMTPEEGGTRAAVLIAGANVAFGALVALATATEVVSFGQIETPALMLPQAPFVRATIDAAVRAQMVFFDASVCTAYRYLALSQHQPVVIPENILLDAVTMGIIDPSLYAAQMLYHGYTPERSLIMATTNIRMPDIGSILELRRRGILTDSGAVDWMVKMKIPYPTAQAVVRLSEAKPESYRAADFAAKGLIDDTTLNSAFSWYGLNPEWAKSWKASQQVFPMFGIALELLWRGVINADTLKMWMHRNSTLPDVTDKMLALAEQIPPGGDLVTMVVREAFEPKYVVEAPPPFAENMAKKGFTKTWSDRYWTAHFLPMPVEQAYDNLRRGYWTKEQFLELLRIADFHPTWREDIYNVAFNPPSIREMGYGYDVGAFTVEDIVKYRRWGGLAEVDAVKVGQAMVAYRTEAEREAVRREYLNLYVLGKLNDDELVEEITAIGTAKEAVPLWLERGQLRRSAQAFESSILEPKAMTRSDAQWLFEHGVYDESWLRGALLNLGYEAETIESYILQSKQKLTEKVTPITAKQLTLAQLRTLYSLKLLNDEQYTARMVSMGYSQSDAQSILQVTIESLKVEPKVVKYNEIGTSQLSNLYYYGFINRPEFVNRLITNGYSQDDAELLVTYYLFEMSLSDIKALYSKGWITKNQMRDEFLDMGLSEDVAINIMMLIIKAEAPMRVATEKDLTKAEIVKGVKVGVITASSAVSLLEDLGYDEDEAWYILAINKVIAIGDPEGYWDMRKVTEAFKKARGEPSVDIPQELIDLESQQRDIKRELENAKLAKASDVIIGEIAVRLASVNSRMFTITSKLNIKS